MTNSNRYLLFFFLLISLSIASCISDTKLTKKEKKYLSNNPDIVVGIYITYPPFVFIDNTGKIDGIIIDYFSKLESNINHTFKKKYYSNWQFLMEDTKNKKVDIFYIF